jgi:hypothetical protein
VRKLQIPSANIQRIFNHQARNAGGCLGLEVWSFSGAWMLVLGASKSVSSVLRATRETVSGGDENQVVMERGLKHWWI